MSLKLYNTATRKKETFTPIDPMNVRMYVCGPTVYDYAHIGNARPAIVFDVLYRLLRHEYGRDHVKYVANITDVDDKINAAAAEQGVPISDITARTAKAYRDDMAAVGVLPPDVEPRATEHVPQMIEMIETLIAKGHAYAADGHVLFDVPSMKDYGALSGRNRDEQIAGARVDVAPYKKDPADFVLWKPSTPDLPGWDSPWGRGRPGWHLECSAMSKQYLGTTFDIHGGGLDLVFPHHENEVAQSRCAHEGAALANYWMHNGFLTVEGETMSKSVGNIVTVNQLLKKWPAEVIRLAMLKTHYRKPLDWTEAGLTRAKADLNRFYGALRGVISETAEGVPAAAPGSTKRTAEVLGKDLNTHLALQCLHRFADDALKADDRKLRTKARQSLRSSGALLGLLQQDPEEWFKGDINIEPAAARLDVTTSAPSGRIMNLGDHVRLKIEERDAAKKRRDYATADQIRDQLMSECRVILEDRPDGTTDWRRA